MTMGGYDDKDIIIGIVLGIIIGLFTFVLLFAPFVYQSDIEELGQSICEEEYGMNFKHYSTKEGLICEDADFETDSYDGIKVRIMN